MKWLIVTQDFPPGFVGGIAAWAHDVAVALHAQGHDVTVLCRNTPDSADADGRQPYRIVRMFGRNWSRFQGTWAKLHAWWFLAPDVRVLTATWSLATELLGPIERKGAQLSVAFHGSDLTREHVARPGLRQVALRAHGLHPVSRFLAAELVRLVPEVRDDPRIRVLPMPLPLPPLHSSPAPRRGLLSVTRLTELKGVDRAITLAGTLGEHLSIVGEGPARATFPDAPHVTWLGRMSREALGPLYAEARGVILLPRTADDGRGAEGLGLCLLEAAAQGAVPIGCRTGGVPEAVGPGILLDDPDHPDVTAVRTRLAEPDLGARCRAFVVAHHGPDRTLAVLEGRP
jgi:glycosyltransferase involved in cell wall biosynthesis